MIAMTKYMKDTIRPDSLRLFKPEYLNRPIEREMNRRRIYRKLRAKGVRPYEAFQISIKRMVIK